MLIFWGTAIPTIMHPGPHFLIASVTLFFYSSVALGTKPRTLYTYWGSAPPPNYTPAFCPSAGNQTLRLSHAREALCHHLALAPVINMCTTKGCKVPSAVCISCLFQLRSLHFSNEWFLSCFTCLSASYRLWRNYFTCLFSLFVFVLRQSLAIWLWIAWHSLCSWGWPCSCFCLWVLNVNWDALAVFKSGCLLLFLGFGTLHRFCIFIPHQIECTICKYSSFVESFSTFLTPLSHQS